MIWRAAARKSRSRRARLRSTASALLDMPDPDHARFEAGVGTGTYIRALARDLGRALGTLAYVTELQRISVGCFTLERAISLAKLEALGHSAAASGHLLPLETALDDIPALALTEAQAKALRCGQAVTPLRPQDRARIDQIGEGATDLCNKRRQAGGARRSRVRGNPSPARDERLA